MAKYTIKHYQKGFEEDQERVGVEVAKTFAVPHQTPAERLKEVYSQPDFDPETRLYCFKGEEMVGFLTSRVLEESEEEEEEEGIKKASLTPPSVLAGHEEATDLLFEKAIEVLKSKGVKKVESRFGVFWSESAETAKRWGYKLKEDSSFLYEIDIKAIDLNAPTENVREFDRERDEDKCAEIIAEQNDRTVEWAKGFFEWTRNEGKEAIVTLLVIQEGEEIVGFSIILRNRLVATLANLYQFYGAEEKYLKQLLAKSAEVCKAMGFEKLLRNAPSREAKHKERYKSLGFSYVGPAAVFEKEL